jgi:hypothetical protein
MIRGKMFAFNKIACCERCVFERGEHTCKQQPKTVAFSFDERSSFSVEELKSRGVQFDEAGGVQFPRLDTTEELDAYGKFA